MFRKNLVPVWVGVLCLTSAFLMGLEPWDTAEPPAPVPKTGQTWSYGIRDDGALQKGVVWPIPRFTANGDGTVTDNLTWLIWTQNADCQGGEKVWNDALDYCNTLADGTCGLSDASSAGDWRLANIFELKSLRDMSSFPALPTGDPFTNVGGGMYWFRYWSSTTSVEHPERAWHLGEDGGAVRWSDKTSVSYVWCVRGGQ